MAVEINIEVFKEQFIAFCEDQFSPCGGFISKLENAKTFVEITSALEKHADDVYEWLGGDPYDKDEVEKLKREVEGLESDKDDLEYQLEDTQIVMGTYLHDEYKRDIIRKYYHDYNPWELEELLKNGKNK